MKRRGNGKKNENDDGKNDKAVKKNVLHKNNGANKKSRLNKIVKITLDSKS